MTTTVGDAPGSEQARRTSNGHDNVPVAFKLQRAVDAGQDHMRGGHDPDAVTVVIYADYLCPYCRHLRRVMGRLRKAFGERLAYIPRHFPNERAHPGAEFIARAAEAAAKQGRFWEMHDWLYEQEPPITQQQVLEFARALGLDMERFRRDVDHDETRWRVIEDVAEGRRNGVTGTLTVFVDGIRYDGAWDFYSMLEAGYGAYIVPGVVVLIMQQTLMLAIALSLARGSNRADCRSVRTSAAISRHRQPSRRPFRLPPGPRRRRPGTRLARLLPLPARRQSYARAGARVGYPAKAPHSEPPPKVADLQPLRRPALQFSLPWSFFRIGKFQLRSIHPRDTHRSPSIHC
jgi:protein-disulfide isomerase